MGAVEVVAGVEDAGRDVSRRRRYEMYKLIRYPELPEWMKDNEYIHARYRPHMNRIRDCFRTGLFSWHNESINIWSHLLGFLFFLVLTLYTTLHLTHINGHFADLLQRALVKCGEAVSKLHDAEDVLFEKFRFVPAAFHGTEHSLYSSAMEALESVEGMLLPSAEDVGPNMTTEVYRRLLFEHRRGMLPMLLGATVCCLGSALYHTVWNHSCETMAIFSRLDYAGIVFLIAGHSMMGTYYTFYCWPQLAFFYVLSIGISTLPVLCTLIYPKFQTPKFRTARALIFVVYGFASATPLLHSGIVHRFYHHEWLEHSQFLLVACCVYLLGALFFATRWPERHAPGRFDLVCNSHQLLHFCVLIGAYLHWYGSFKSLSYRLTHGCTMSPLFS